MQGAQLDKSGAAALRIGMTMIDGYARYAIFYDPPPGSALAALGESWLGRDAAGADRPRAACALDSDEQARITREARRYGLHGTLKPPFRLAEGVRAADLASAIEAFCRTRAAVVSPPLSLASLDGFLSLRPAEPSPALDLLAAEIVAVFDEFRAPLSDVEIARRRPETLSPRRRSLLAHWGYPYVFDQFRFHITLSARLDAAAEKRARSALEPLISGAIGADLTVDALALYGDPGDGAPFRRLARWGLHG